MSAIKREKAWNSSTVIADIVGERENYVKNVANLLKSDHTIPFIARYRKEMTGDMSTEGLYKIKEQIQRLENLEKKINKSLIDIEKLGKLSPKLSEAIAASTSLTTLEQVTAEFKPGKKKSRSEQAKVLGLGKAVDELFSGRLVNYDSLVASNSNLKSVKSAVDGTKDILADIVKTNKGVLELCERISKNGDNFFECSKSKSKAETDDKKEKFDQYFDFKRNIGSLKHFQVMAINRGENLKALSVKINIGNHAQNSIKYECKKVLKSIRDENLKEATVEDACSRLIFPLICRRIRSRLTEDAVDSSLDVFANNLKHLLLTRPVKGIKVMAIDPGYKHGCKIAVVGEKGQVLATDVVYLQLGSNKQSARFGDKDELKLQSLQTEYGFNTIAIGNGTACRESETAVAKMIGSSALRKGTVYTMVDERGASVYSVTPLAEEELPDMGTNQRSAVSIGRRLLEPLSEYVKIEPKHLGVGQYQHDIAQTKLNNRLDEVVTEAVSFTGLDINTCGQHMLQKIAGLTKARAAAIISTRKEVGNFTNRQQVQKIKGIGPKSFEQCIGFLRIYPEDIKRENNSDDGDEEYVPQTNRKRKLAPKPGSSKVQKMDIQYNYLDQTSVHPESYHVANKIIKDYNLKIENIGTESFVNTIKGLDPEKVTATCDEATKHFILTSLSQPINTDYRDQFSKPMFKSEIVCASKIAIGTELEGRVSNVTHFGAFVDVGLEKDGLIHISKMKGRELCLGNKVRVNVDKNDFKGIGLRLVEVLG